jgi:NitT/TauT family transport system substrate-binding protein
VASTVVAAVLLLGACAPSASAPPAPGAARPPAEASQPAPPAAVAPAPAPAGPETPAAAAGPLPLTKPLAPLSQPVTVKTRVGTSLTTGAFWYALEKGYFDQLGITLEEVDLPNSNDMVPPLATGQIDVAAGSFGAGLYNAVTRDIPVKAVSDNGKLDENLAGSATVVRKGTLAEYGNDWCALKGKRVILQSRGTGMHSNLVKALESCNLTLKDVDIVELGFAETNLAIVNGSADVAWQVEPFVSRGVQDGTLDIWKPLDQAWKGQQMVLVMYSPKFFQDRDVGLRFLVAYLAGARDYRRAIESGADKQEMGQILARHLAIKDPNAYAGMIMMGVDPNGEVDLATVREAIRMWQDEGSVPAAEIRLDWIDDTLRKEALGYLRPYTR